METEELKVLLQNPDPVARVAACKVILEKRLLTFAGDLNYISKKDEDWFVRIWAGYVLFNFNPVGKKLFHDIVKEFFKTINKNEEYKSKVKDELYQIYSSFDYTISQIDTIILLSHYTLANFPKNIPEGILNRLDDTCTVNHDHDEDECIDGVDFVSAPTTSYDIDSLMGLFKDTDIKKRKAQESFFAYKSSKKANPYLYPKGALNYLEHVNNQIVTKKATKKSQVKEFNRVIYSNQVLLYLLNFESYVRDIQYIIYKTKPKKFQSKLLKNINKSVMWNSANTDEFLTNLVHNTLNSETISLMDRMAYFDAKLKIHFGVLEHDKDFFFDAIEVKNIIINNRSIVDKMAHDKLRILNLQEGELIQLDSGFTEKISYLIEDLSGYLCLRVLQSYLKYKV